MPNDDTNPTDPTAGTPPENEGEQPPAPASGASSNPAPIARQSRVISVPTGRMAEIKKAERAKGQRAAQQAADNAAKELGYSSHEDMIAKLKAKQSRSTPAAGARAATPPPEADAEPAPAAASGRSNARTQRELARAQEQRKAANRARAASERREKQARRELEAREAEHELSLAAVRHGVQDTDYALTLLKRKLAKLSAKELEAFDEDQYFKVELRKTHPLLYVLEERPADTSPTSSKETPRPGPTTPPAPPNGKKDAREMSRPEFEQSLRSRGYQLPHLGSPS